MNKIYVKAITLIELIITLAVLAILSIIALPHYHNLMAKRELNHVSQILRQAIQTSKSWARLHQSNMVICPSSSGQQCQTGEWNQGFIIFKDSDRDRQLDNNESIFNYTQLNLKYGDLTWRGTLSIPSLTFNAAQGLPIGSNGSFYYCAKTSNNHLRLVLSKMGHERTESPKTC